MIMRLTPEVIDRIIGQTPCLCGDIETWHARCYRGKTQEEVTQAYKRAYRIAAKKIRQQQANAAAAAIDAAISAGREET